MLPVVNIKPDRTMANKTLPGANVKLKKTLIINSIQCSTRDERKSELDHDPEQQINNGTQCSARGERKTE